MGSAPIPRLWNRAGSSGRASRATWSVERTAASEHNLLSQGVGPVGSRTSNFIDAEEVRQMTGGKGIPGSWYWQHDIPGYRGTYQEEPLSMHARALPSPCALAPAPSMVPAPTPLSDRFRLSWEAGIIRPIASHDTYIRILTFRNDSQ